MYRYSFFVIVLLAAATQANAQGAKALFEDGISHDFGSVPRGQVVTHYFRIVNNTKQSVRIASVRVSCNRCSSARALQTHLAPGQETAIFATMDTNLFQTPTKLIDILVVFDQPRWEEVRLWMQANSRDDVVFSPDNIAFGRVKRGTTPEAKMSISFLSANGIEITDVKSESNYVQPIIKQVPRGSGETVYEVSAKLRDDTPPGKWYTDVWLSTNHPAMPKLRVPVTVEVEASLSVSPSTISLGEVKAGEQIERNVMIRGVRPFRIIGITGSDAQMQVRSTNNESKQAHVLTVTLSPRDVGELTRRIRVQTDLKTNGDIEFEARAEVVK